MIGMQKYIDNVVCIVLLYCFQIQRKSVRRFEIQIDHTVNYSNSVSENKLKALDPTLSLNSKARNFGTGGTSHHIGIKSIGYP